MRIGTVNVDTRLILAPMAGVTDLGFRTVCRELGAGYTVTEMVSAKALCYQDKKSIPLVPLPFLHLNSWYLYYQLYYKAVMIDLDQMPPAVA